MLPLTGKEKRKYLDALKEKNASGGHIVSDPSGVQLRKGAKKRYLASPAESSGCDVEMAVGITEKARGDEVTDPVISPQEKKTKGGLKDSGKGEKSVAAEGEKRGKKDSGQSFWHRDFNYRQYMEDHVPFSAVDEAANFHGKFEELVQDAGTSALRFLVYVHSMERKYEALEKEFHDSVKEVEKYKHKAAAFEERVEGLLQDKTKAEKNATHLETEKTAWLKDKRDLEDKVGVLEEDLSKTKNEVESGRMALAGYFEEGFERAKTQVLHFYPELDISGLDSLKIVDDGELVDEP